MARPAEVEHFIDFLMQRDEDRAITQAAMAPSEPTLQAIRENPEDAVHDGL